MKTAAWCATVSACALAAGTFLFLGSDDAKQPCVAARDLWQIHRMAEAWKVVHGRYPQSLREMVLQKNSDDVLGFEGYPIDPYGREYGYWIVDDEPLLIFYGADGAAGGEGEDKDWLWPRDASRARSVPRRCVAR